MSPVSTRANIVSATPTRSISLLSVRIVSRWLVEA